MKYNHTHRCITLRNKVLSYISKTQYNSMYEILGLHGPGAADMQICINSDMQMTQPLWQKVKKNERAS